MMGRAVGVQYFEPEFLNWDLEVSKINGILAVRKIDFVRLFTVSPSNPVQKLKK